MSSPVLKSFVAPKKYGSPPLRHGRHGRRSVSPHPPQTEPVTETRRIMLNRKVSGDEDTRFVMRTMQSFLNEQSSGNLRDNANQAAELGDTRQRSSVVHVVTSENKVLEPSLNRRDSCPILVRVFYSTDGRHTPLSQFSNGKFPANEIQINTWPDATLRELSKEVMPAIRTSRGSGFRLQARPARLNFATVFPDPNQRGVYRKREIGSLIFSSLTTTSEASPAAGGQPDDGDVSLFSKHFQIGDYLDVAISDIGQPGPRAPYAHSGRNQRNYDDHPDHRKRSRY